MKRLLTIVSVIAAMTFALASTLSAQSKVGVKGKVSDTDGEPLIGVAVIEQGTSNGVMTDAEGNYVISVTKTASLLFDYMGFKQVIRPVSGRQVIDVVLEEDRTQLDEAVVVGYGTMRRSDLTGSVSSVSAKSIENFKTGNVLDALGGAVAGVNITTTDGTPGSGFSIIIRGVGTVNGDSSPLYIVDGFEADGIDHIANQDIASISDMVAKVKHKKEVGINYMKSWEYEEWIKDEAFKDGFSDGFNDGSEQMSQLILRLTEAGRIDDLTKAASDADFRKQLFQEFGIGM